MKSLITGGAGFIGSHLADALLARGESVLLVDNLSTGRELNIAHLLTHPDVEFRLGSVLDEDLVRHAVRDSDRVFHLAASVGVNLIIERPLEAITNNTRGAEVVIEACADFERPVLVASTSEIYGKNTGLLSEDSDRILGSPLKSRWSYGTAKALDEILAYTYHVERGTPTVVVRLFNCVGPRQTGRYGMVVPRFVRQALEGQPVTVYGTGEQTRCFCHVADTVEALVGLMDEPAANGSVYNVGANDELSMNDLAERVIKMIGSSSSVIHVPYDEAYEAGFEDMERRVPDIRRITSLTGWEPTRSLDQILDDVIESDRLLLGGGTGSE